MKFLRLLPFVCFFFVFVSVLNAQQKIISAAGIWSKEKAKAWYAKQGWLVGANFAPSNAINQLEMWQAETFDTATNNRELGWAASLGMNTVRVFLHDLAYEQDPEGFLNRMDEFLRIAARHRIKPLFVFFDSVWDPFPKAGKQREPKPHVHNSGWVQSPGVPVLQDSTQHPRLEKYVKAVVYRFRSDNRILGWDVWNEPDNVNPSSYNQYEPKNKDSLVYPLLKKTFAWVRSQKPVHPVTSGIWQGDWTKHADMKPIWRLQIEESDIVSFHNYDKPIELEKRIKLLQRYGRPIICTEYMARGNGSYFNPSLSIGKRYNVGMYNWGFVAGKTNTIYPWDSWQKQYTEEPLVWFHDIFRPDGTPYNAAEVTYIRQMTGKVKRPVTKPKKKKAA